MSCSDCSECVINCRFRGNGYSCYVDAVSSIKNCLSDADNSSEYKDVVDTAENNFKSALTIVKTHFTVKELKK